MKNVFTRLSVGSSSLLLKLGGGAVLFGSPFSSALAQEVNKDGLSGIGQNLLGETAAFFSLFQAGGVILGAGMIVAALISWFLRSKKGAQAQQDTLWWPYAMLIGVLLIYSTSFTDSVGTSVLGDSKTPAASLDGTITNPTKP